MVPDSFPHLFWGYAVIWFVFGVYFASLGMRLRKLEKRVEKRKK
jgi:CcmD family protein